MIRDIIATVLTFILGAGAATAYFYHIHPEHSFTDDISRFRQDYDSTVDAGKDVQQRWTDGDDDEGNTAQPDPESGQNP